MAENTVGGNGQSMQRAAEISLNQALVKYVLPALCGAAMLFAGIVGGRVLASVDEFGKVLATVQTDVAVMKNDIGYLKADLKSKSGP